jgi:hypothetical protein
MLDDGVYELTYRAVPGEPAPDAPTPGDSALVVLRKGRVLGCDCWGGVFLGQCQFDPVTDQHRVRLQLRVPPGGVLVTGMDGGPEGGTVEIATVLDARGPGVRAVVDVAGAPVEIALRYCGPVPR